MNEHFYKTYEKVKTHILLRLLLPILLVGSLPIALHATHIVGGEIGYKCLGSNQYEITLKVYRDCFNGLEDFDRPAYIGIYDPAGNLVRRLDIPFNGVRDTLNPALNDPCLVVPGNVCVDTATYRAVVALSPNPTGGFYQISYVRCCRNKIIKNILEPEEVGAVYDIFLTTEAMQRCNSSPTFNKLPPNYICADKPFVFDHSATDLDGDSLVYKICTPFSGGSVTFPKPVPPRNPPPFDELEWAPGFGLNNLFGSGEPLRIDPVTGVLTARPLLQGTFVVGVCVEEYDRATGRLLSITRRDFQYDIGICGDIRSAFFAPEVGCELTVAFNNTSENSNQFRWFFDYPRTNLTSTERSPTFTFPAVGTYIVALIAQPGSNCVDTFLQQITIVDNTIDIQLSVGVVDCDTTSLLNLQDLSVDTASAIVAWNWTVTYGDLVTQTSNAQNPRFTVPIGAAGNVSLTVTSANNCTKTVAVPFETSNDPIPVDVIPSQIAACQGDSVPINPNAPINSGVVYSWSPANLLDDPTSPNPIFIATETTVFTVTLGPADGSCVTTKVVTVNVGPLPSLIVTDTICALDLQSYAIRFLSDGDRITATPGILVNNGDGSYTVSNIPNGQFVEIFAGYAGNSCNVRVAIGPYSCQCPELPPPVSDGDKAVCENEPLPLLTVTVGTGQTADWFDAPTGGVLLLSGSLSYQPTQAGTYYAVAREISTGCTSSTRTPVTLLVNPAPMASISLSSSIICPGEMVQITATATGGTPDYSFVWNDGTTAPIRVVNPLETTVYAVTVTDENNCRSEASATITVNQPPAIDLESDAPNNTICIGQSATLAANVSGGVEPYIVLWDDGSTSLIRTVSPSSTTTYDLTVTDANGCTATASITIIVNNPPEVTITSDAINNTICEGESATLTANVSQGTAPFSYLWDDGSTGVNRVVSPSSTTTYSVTVTDASGCEGTGTITIVVNERPIAMVSADRDTICAGEAAQLSAMATGGSGGYTFRWSNGFEGVAQSVMPSATTTYSVTATDSNGCSSDAAEVTIVVRPTPEVTVNATLPVICRGQSTTISAEVNGGTPPYQYSWSNGFGGVSQVVSPTETTTYTVTVSDANGCEAIAVVTITVSDSLDVQVTADAANNTICEGQSATLQATASNGLEPYVFSWSNGFEGSSQVISPSLTTTYAVTATDVNGCRGTAEITITVNERPIAMVSAARDTICAGEAAQLSAMATGGSGGYTFRWSNGFEGATQSVMPSATTTYSVTATDSNGCSSDAAEITIVVRPTPEVTIEAAPPAICIGQSTVLTATATAGMPPYQYAWSNGSNDPIQTVSPSSTTTYDLTVTDANGCTATASITIIVNNPPEVTITSDAINNTICEGESATLTANVSQGTAPFSYLWDDGSTGVNRVVSPSSTTTYSVTVTDASGCEGTGTITIVVNERPIAMVSAARDTICAGEAAQLSAMATGGSGGYTFRWSNGFEGVTQSVMPSATTTYSVTATDSNGCSSDAAEITIVVRPTPEVTIEAAPPAICIGQSTVLTATATAGMPPYQYAWSNGSNDPIQTVSPSSTTTYDLTVTDANGCTATASITIIVNNPPEVTITSDAINNTICEGESATLTANVSQGTAPFSYLWDDGSTGVNRVVSPSSTTTYSVTVTDASGCEGTGTITIVVNERPIAMVSADRDTICAGEAAQLSAMATGGSGGYTFRWSNGFEGVTQSVMPSATTTYSVTATDSSGCSSDAAEITIVVRPTPEVDAGADQAACKGEPVILTATITSGTAPYVVQWSNGFEGLSQIVNPTEPTTYVVSITDVNGCSATDAVFVDVLPRPNDFPPDTVQACANTPTRLNPNGNPNLIYEWSPANILDDPTAPNPLVTTNEDVQVFVTITYPNTGCFFMDTVQVRVAPPIGLEISFDTLVCQKDFILLANTAASGVQIVWADNPEFEPILGTGNQVPVVLPFGETRYYARATDASGCTQTDSFLIESYPVEATLPSTTVICLPTDPVILTVTNLDPQQNLTYNWSPSNGIIGSATAATVQANPQVASRFSVSIQNQFGCNLELASTIVIIDLPRIVNVAANPDTIFAGQTSQLNASGCNLCTFEWSPGGTLSNPRIANPVATPTETTDYTLTVTQGECVATFPVRVVVINAICDKDHIYLPTAFTPNGDGQNDIWQLRSTFLDELLSVELIVYNRWGQKVFETRNPRIGWDGTFRNEQLPPDVYGYYLRVVCPGQEELIQKGNLTLLR